MTEAEAAGSSGVTLAALATGKLEGEICPGVKIDKCYATGLARRTRRHPAAGGPTGPGRAQVCPKSPSCPSQADNLKSGGCTELRRLPASSG